MVLVGVGTEVHAGCDPREGPPFFPSKAAVDRHILIGHLCEWPRTAVQEDAPGIQVLREKQVKDHSCLVNLGLERKVSQLRGPGLEGITLS